MIVGALNRSVRLDLACYGMPTCPRTNFAQQSAIYLMPITSPRVPVKMSELLHGQIWSLILMDLGR
jgi:hypothetical protein